jgi:UDP-N-acetylmuramyl pentapeptide phosphotransferase/UDP-N-acetylglucosamine-1-phosphate transferase
MESLLILSGLIILVLFLNYFLLKYDFFVDKKNLIHKSFISKKTVPLSGGFLIIASLIFVKSNLSYINFFFFLIFFLGILSDLLVLKSPLKKFLFQVLIIFVFIYSKDFYILSTKVYFIDFLIENKIFAILFTCFCILVLINGSNFIDGVNTLASGYFILVILSILYLGKNDLINYNFDNFYYLLLPLLVFFIFNLYSKIYFGDAGTFLVSFVLAYYLIDLSNNNLVQPKFISPMFILFLLWYPGFENLFSLLRKILKKKNPTHPDNLHLHHLFYTFLKKKIKKNICINSLTGILINFYNLLIFFIGVQFYYSAKYLTFILILNIFIYIFFYFYLLKFKIDNVDKVKIS